VCLVLDFTWGSPFNPTFPGLSKCPFRLENSSC
jgi:hypothetical protein